MSSTTDPEAPETPPGEHAGARSPARSRRSSASGSKVVFWVLATLLVAFPAITLPEIGAWLGVKAFVLEAAGVIVAIVVVSRGDWTWTRVKAALLAGPNPFILLFLAWIGLSAARSPLPGFSRYEAMRHLGGGLVYFAVAYGVSPRHTLGRFVGVLSLAGSLAAALALRTFGDDSQFQMGGAFRNSQLLAAFLCLIMPVVLMASQADDEPWRKTAHQIAMVILAAGILMSRNRSAWVGSLIALVAIGILYLLTAREGGVLRLEKHQIVVPVVMVVLAVGLFLAQSNAGGFLAQRASTIRGLRSDQSFQWRLGMWDKARRMIRDRPVLGFGVGTFPVQQALYYHPACPTRQQSDIVATGPLLDENAHNTYLQMGAEIGIPGLLLYLSIFIAFFVTGIRELPYIRRGFRQAILIACLAAVAAQIAAAVGTPAWEFPECSLLLWLVLGLGMATAGIAVRGRDAIVEEPE